MRPRLHPQLDNLDWVPDDMAISRLRSCGSEDTKKTDDRENDGNHQGLDVLCARFVRISAEIGDIETQCCVIPKDSVKI